MKELDDLAWPISMLDQALQSSLQKCSFPLRPGIIPPLETDVNKLDIWVNAAAQALGLDAESIDIPVAQLQGFIQTIKYTLLRLPGVNVRFLIGLGGEHGKVKLFAPDLQIHKVSAQMICSAVCHELEIPLIAKIDSILANVNLSQAQHVEIRTTMLQEQISPRMIEAGWLLRLSSTTSFNEQIKHANLWQTIYFFIAAYIGQYLLWLGSWWVIGQSVLQNQLNLKWLITWALVLVILVFFRLFTAWTQGKLTMGIGNLLKQRLLDGALQLEPDEIRHQGMGQLLGRVLEAEAVETLVLSGSLLGLTAVIELLIAALVLGNGAGGWLQVLLLVGWLIFGSFLGWRYYHRRNLWTETRLEMTYNLIEKMVGHRTRLAQEARENWHVHETETMTSYQSVSGAMDLATAQWITFIARGWLLLGFLGLMPTFILDHGSITTLAVSLGGILLAYQALEKLSPGILHLIGASIAWKHVSLVFNAASRRKNNVQAFNLKSKSDDSHPVVEVKDIAFQYQQNGIPILNKCNLNIFLGEHLLVEGPSGGGKSTLMALLTGLRQPTSGQIIFNKSVNIIGQKHIAAAPQFHENYVFTETFAFNLLMGRRWPPQAEDIQDAETICGELGLQDLLARMPAGMMQMVGETGWQLSHGERSRLYIARALLQDADVIALDESFSALDPETLQQALECVIKHARTLILIAHP